MTQIKFNNGILFHDERMGIVYSPNPSRTNHCVQWKGKFNDQFDNLPRQSNYQPSETKRTEAEQEGHNTNETNVMA